MKITTLLTAAAVVLTGIAPLVIAAPAEAQHRVVVRERTVVRHNGGARVRHHTRRVCTNKWRGGHRVRSCRTVRY